MVIVHVTGRLCMNMCVADQDMPDAETWTAIPKLRSSRCMLSQDLQHTSAIDKPKMYTRTATCVVEGHLTEGLVY